MNGPVDSIEALVIGASAGAVEALSTILPVFGKSCQFPVIAVVHLPPRHRSMLVEIFAPKCALPVREPLDKEKIEPGIWFAPPDYHLLVEADRTFALSVSDPCNLSRPSIDVLFTTAAEVYASHLVALVLTGSNSDGALGAHAIRRAGGFVIAQDPDTAQFPTMPRAACEDADPQMIDPLESIAMFLRGLTLVS